MHIIIVRRPSGEAPEWVRDAWIGMTLPLLVQKRRKWRGVGVLSGPARYLPKLWAVITGNSLRVEGFVVRAPDAIERLERHNPDAARWWRTHAPHMMRRRAGFIFEAVACDVVR